MQQDKKVIEPDNTAIRTALWRALHVQVDAKPNILEDEIGLKLIAPTIHQIILPITKGNLFLLQWDI